MSDRDEAWQALHDPATDATTLAAIAQAHPEFAEAIAAHPNCYPGLAAWARSVAPDEAAPAEPETGAASRAPSRRTWLVGAIVAGGVILVGGSAWAAIAVAGSLVPAASGGNGPAPQAPPGERELAGAPVYIGDELEWFVLPDADLQRFFPGAQQFEASSEFFMVGESEGVRATVPECLPWVIFDGASIVNTRRVAWDLPTDDSSQLSGDYAVYQFPTPEIAQDYYDALAGSLGSCTEFQLLDSDDVGYLTWNIDVVAGGAEEGVFVVDSRTHMDGSDSASTMAYAIEGNVVVRVRSDRAEGDVVDGQGLADALRDATATARAELTEKIGYR